MRFGLEMPAQRLSDLDASMQRLLEVAQKNSMVQTYRAQVKTLQGQLLALEKVVLQTGGRSSEVGLEPIDHVILDTLVKLLPPAARSYEQAITDLHFKNRLSWRGPATDLRESLRETLDHLAPDADVMAEVAFKLEKDASAPTMKQKVRFILRKRGMSKTAIERIARSRVAAVVENHLFLPSARASASSAICVSSCALMYCQSGSG